MFTKQTTRKKQRRHQEPSSLRTRMRVLSGFERLENRNLLAGDITIYAAGETGAEVMDLLVDGRVVRSWANVAGNPGARNFLPFTDSTGNPVSADRIRVAFTNDLYQDGVIDRNLYVDKIVIDGISYETEAPSVYSTGSWLPADGIVAGYRRSEVLHGDGYFQYAAAASGSLIRIQAAGATGNENLSLFIDDQQVATWTAIGGNADSGSFNEFSYRAATQVRANQVKVAFTNDVYAPPVDYNLRVDRIIVDGAPYESESPTTYSTGTYVPANGTVFPGYWQSEWLHSNGYFQYDVLVTRPGAFGLDSSVMATRENNGSVVMTILRSNGSDGAVSIDYKMNPGSATANSDYRPAAGTLSFAPGEIRRTVTIPLVNDSIAEAPETFSFVIENPRGGATLMAPRTATITITDDDLILPSYTDFSSGTGIKLNGNATLTSSTLELTPNLASRRGTAFYTTAIPIKSDTSFQTQFQFQTLGSTTGGEGLTFMLQNDSRGTSALGTGAAGLGYSGITKSLGIEFDTVKGTGEINANHVSIWSNGTMTSALSTQAASVDFNSGQVVNVWIDYHGDSDVLSVFVASTNVKPASPLVTTNVDVAALVGGQGYFGFSAATSTLANAHRIKNWRMNLDRPATGAGSVPTSLVNQTIVTGLNLPTTLKFDPTGRNMYIAEKSGRVIVVRDGVTQQTPFIDIRNQTNSASDRGLMDLALHPNFPATPYVYLLYTVDPAEVNQYPNHEFAGPDKSGNRAGRLIRVTANAATNYTTAVAGSEVILLGKNSTWNNFNGFINSTLDLSAPQGGVAPNGAFIQDFIASDSESHTVASLAFAPDGSLYVSIGDGASYNSVDARAVRVQSVDSLSGKVLRINPIDGRGYANNPFSDGNLDSNRSKVYQLGLRNPFRMTVNPTTGQLYVGDVGWTQWEEINSAGAGANFGWPYYEGGSGSSLRTTGYENLSAAQTFYANGQKVTPSLFALNHAADGINAIIMGSYYSATAYPSQYHGNLFFNDLGQGIVRTAKLNAAGQVVSVETFATGAQYVVQITQGPDGNLYYVDLDDGIIGRWQFVADSAATPLVRVAASAVQSTINTSSPSVASTAKATVPGTSSTTSKDQPALVGKPLSATAGPASPKVSSTAAVATKPKPTATLTQSSNALQKLRSTSWLSNFLIGRKIQ